MRIATVDLSWFRGAATEAKLRADGISLAVYGTNGSGKSSFVDGIEVCLCAGKTTHLSNEYSGRFQEKAVVNTHRPIGSTTIASIKLSNGEHVSYQWAASAPRASVSSQFKLQEWDYRRIALRQDEISDFIKSSKGEKYSALLPLLGLLPMETAAENLRRLIREITTSSKLAVLKSEAAAIDVRCRNELGSEWDDDSVIEALDQLEKKYADVEDNKSAAEVAGRVSTAIDERLKSLGLKSREAVALQLLAKSSLPDRLEQANNSATRIRTIAEPLVRQRLDVLNSADAFCKGLDGTADSIKCPACGTEVKIDGFRAHITTERERLEEAEMEFTLHREALGLVCDELARLRDCAFSEELTAWRAAQGEEAQRAVQSVQQLDVRSLRSNCTDVDLALIQMHSSIVINAASEGGHTPPDITELMADKNKADTIKAYLEFFDSSQRVQRVEALLGFLGALEDQVRGEIREQAKRIFDKISTIIQELWNILHPGQKISGVRLHVPNDADKAIDIALVFHGVEQQSPRLTLSEGQRNALGLCVFLAMAKAGGSKDHPIILDDVVISLDRDHRSYVAALLENEFADRQIILLTHDREWYFELCRFLNNARWNFQRLLPWDSPQIGIQFAQHATDFAKAKSKVATDPEDAESNVRRIMDISLSEIAEMLEVPMPYLRGDENDHRTAGQFMPRIISRANKAFKIRNSEGVFEKNAVAITVLDRVIPQLAQWVNRATHTFSASKTEAELVIENCEQALSVFTCSECKSPVWMRVDQNGNRDCRCGNLQWRR